MARTGSPLFLARRSYRRRRLRDAARLLPIVGLFLLLLPILWMPDGRINLTAADIIYFFVVWIGLILAAAAFSRGLRPGDRPEEDED
jgi:peptidoglycan/LPS O-acetylase OafA/YrhL